MTERHRVPQNPVQLMVRMYRHILPETRRELARWRREAESIPNEELRLQAISSMTTKQFHCEGGAVYAAFRPEQRHILIPLIVAFQTISDYLDNLCDRSTSLDERDFRELHGAMLDAITPEAPLGDYYRHRNDRDDNGYLHRLVRTCQSCVLMLPSYGLVRERVREWVGLYGDLQVYKHLHRNVREERLHAWWNEHRHKAPGYRWNEFAAATGSTLGVFMLFCAAADPRLQPDEVESIAGSYFPSICALHILLDYLIDQEEDRRGGDLNFCSYYEDERTLIDRLEAIVRDARRAASVLKHPRFHRMIVEGLVALYLSDPKVKKQDTVVRAARQLMRASPLSRLFFWVNSVVIRNT